MNKKQKALLIAGAILVCLMGLLSRGLRPPSQPKEKPATRPVSALPKSTVGSALPRRTAKIEPVKPPGRDDFAPYTEWSLKRILSTFMVPPGQIQATDTDELVAQLEAIYTEYGGPGLDLAFQPGGEFDPPISIDHDNISFDSLLKLIGIVAGHDVHIGESKVTLTPLQTDPSREIVSSDQRVPASLLERRPHIDDDPFSDPPAFDPKRAFEHKFFEVRAGADIGMELQTFATQAETSAFVQELIRSQDVTTVSHPRIMTRNGQSAMVESSIAMPIPTALDAEGNPSEFDLHTLGMQLPFTPSLAGLDRIHINGAHETSELREGVAQEDGRITEVLSETDFVNTATDIQGQLFPENTALIPYQRADGTTTYQLLNVQRLDSSGRPVSP